MTIYEANRAIEEKENELRYLKEVKQLAFESTQPKAIQPNDISVQSSHLNRMYEKLDYSIDEIEPRIAKLEKELSILKKYKKNYYEILEKYDPIQKQIIVLREEKHMTWDKIAQACNYSERSCHYKYDEYKKSK